MGVSGLWNYLKSNATAAFSPLKCIRGKVVAVDGGMILTTSLKTSATLEGWDIWKHDFAATVLKKLYQYEELGCRCIVVLDGDAPSLKNYAHDKRREQRKKYEEKIAHFREMGDTENELKAFRSAISMNSDIIEFSKRLLAAAGVEVVQATGEAEVYCAKMTMDPEQDIWGVVTEDGDTLVAGAKRIIRNFSGCLTVVDRDIILAQLNITPKQFRLMAAMCGTDFGPGLFRVGPVKARNLAQMIGEDDDVTGFIMSSAKNSKLEEAQQIDEISKLYGEWTDDDQVPEEHQLAKKVKTEYELDWDRILDFLNGESKTLPITMENLFYKIGVSPAKYKPVYSTESHQDPTSPKNITPASESKFVGDFEVIIDRS